MSDLVDQLRARERFVTEGPRYLQQMCERAADELDRLRTELVTKKRELEGQVLLFQDAVNDNEALRARIVELNDNVALRARIAELEKGYVIPEDHAGHNSVLDLVHSQRKELAEAKRCRDNAENALEAANARIVQLEAWKAAFDDKELAEAREGQRDHAVTKAIEWNDYANELLIRAERAEARIAELEGHLKNAGVYGNAGRYWEGRWRDAEARVAMLREVLELAMAEIDKHQAATGDTLRGNPRNHVSFPPTLDKIRAALNVRSSNTQI